MIGDAWQRMLGRLPRRQLPSNYGSNQAYGPLLDEEYLQQIGRLSLYSTGALTEWLVGEHPGRRKGQALEFDDYRGYAPGDDFRSIDWNAYARLGELYVKTSQAPETIALALLIDCSRSMDWGRPNKLWYAKRLAVALGAMALLHFDTVQLYRLGDGEAQAGSLFTGPGALHAFAEELGRMPVAATTDLLHGIGAFQQTTSLRGITALISDLLVPDEELEALGALTTDGVEAAAIHIVDPTEAVPTMSGAVELADRETGELVTLAVTPDVRRRYIAGFEARLHAIEDWCAAHELRYFQVSTAVPPIDILAGTFREEGLLQA